MQHKKQLHFSPAQTIAISFAIMIFTGAVLLTLPIASKNGQSVGFVNALFTATSANCVTGQVVVNTMQQWSIFGKAVILVLIQLGGLGFISILTVSLMVLQKRISLRNRITIQAAFNQDNTGGMVRFIKRVIAITLIAEGTGAVLLAVSFWASGLPAWQSVYYGIFHSISAFCNAGFDILSTESLVPYVGNLPINAIIGALVVIGGLGFTVWIQLFALVRNPQKKRLRHRIKRLSLHTKMALLVTAVLLGAGFVFFLLLEWNNPATLGPLSWPQKLMAAMFQSITLRTAGFNTISQAGLTDVSKMISCLLMVIGGSPAGTAGGIKTVTLGVIFASIFSALKGRNRAEAFGRTLPLQLLQKALTVTVTLFAVVFSAAFVLYFTEQGSPFPHTMLDLLYETSSAAGTVGVTTGITPYLSTAGKLVVTLCMYLGRLSPVTVVAALNLKMKSSNDNLRYPDETVIIG